MRPIKVEFQAFGPYVGHEMVDFENISEKGLFLICGKTGIGKTMILDAITFALYGKSSGHSRDNFESMRCTNADFAATTFVKFEFENNGEYYIFERRLERKRKNLSASYNLMQKDEEGVWRTLLENAKEKALNEKAVEIIGLEYEQFSQVIVLPQGKFEKLLTSSSDEKEKILTSIFGEDKWQEIAEQLYKEVVERKEALKAKKDKIRNSLKEEECESIADLTVIITSKEKQLENMDQEYQAMEYEKQKEKFQALLSVAKRFGDLHTAEKKVAELAAQEDGYQAWKKEIEEAIRANKVRKLLDDEKIAKKAFTDRQEEAKSAHDIANEKKEKAIRVEKQLKEHNEKTAEIEEKREIKIQYEAKKTDYNGLDNAGKAVKKAKNVEKAAKAEEETAKKELDAFGPKIVTLQNEYSCLNEEHKELLESYLAGITGEIAAQLVDGKPCPVCGSRLHPQKAIKADNSVTKAMVDERKKSAEEKYNMLQTSLNQQEAAKVVYEEKHNQTQQKHIELVAAETKLEEIQKNLVEGVATLKELEAAIENLEHEISNFDRQKTRLEADEKAAREAFTEAKAKIESAENELKVAEEKLAKDTEAAQKGLKENKFCSEEEAEALMLEEEKNEELRKKIADYEAAVKTAKENLETIRKELEGKTEPDEKLCQEKLKSLSKEQILYAEERGILDSEIKRLKGKKTKLEAEGDGIEEKIHEAEEDFAFSKKLRGDSGTGLQRYVLGIMFSSVVAAANKMLEMVHGGRYRLYRSDDKAQGSNKRGLELKVLDKNSEGHEGRFVSTLSGGEKFLASLALSIGMSTVAQKSGIKIEALFIDEGFGSLDEESIDDAMNVLNSIQEANGLVGIISHVQILQDRIPTKLRVEEIEKGSHIVETIG
jgi:DNA repair protein SbcC/Rad50